MNSFDRAHRQLIKDISTGVSQKKIIEKLVDKPMIPFDQRYFEANWLYVDYNRTYKTNYIGGEGIFFPISELHVVERLLPLANLSSHRRPLMTTSNPPNRSVAQPVIKSIRRVALATDPLIENNGFKLLFENKLEVMTRLVYNVLCRNNTFSAFFNVHAPYTLAEIPKMVEWPYHPIAVFEACAMNRDKKNLPYSPESGWLNMVNILAGDNFIFHGKDVQSTGSSLQQTVLDRGRRQG